MRNCKNKIVIINKNKDDNIKKSKALKLDGWTNEK